MKRRGTYQRKSRQPQHADKSETLELPTAGLSYGDDDEVQTLRVTIGRIARTAREKKKLLQADIAERVGLSPEFYARIERGYCLPSITTLARMAIVLDVEADVLIGRQSAQGSAPTPIREDNASEDPTAIRRVTRLLRKARPRTLRIARGVLDDIDERARESDRSTSK